MELLKRTIRQALTTGTTESCTGHCHVIIPDLNAVYNLGFLITSEKHDFGFFDGLDQGELGPDDVVLTVQELEELLSGDTASPTTTTTTTVAVHVPTLPATTTGDYTVILGRPFDSVANNLITSSGNTIVTEYGILWTDNAAYGTSSTLIYGNYPANVNAIITTLPPDEIVLSYGRKIIPTTVNMEIPYNILSVARVVLVLLLTGIL